MLKRAPEQTKQPNVIIEDVNLLQLFRAKL